MALEESALAASLSSKRKKALCHLDKAVVNDLIRRHTHAPTRAWLSAIQRGTAVLSDAQQSKAAEEADASLPRNPLAAVPAEGVVQLEALMQHADLVAEHGDRVPALSGISLDSVAACAESANVLGPFLSLSEIKGGGYVDFAISVLDDVAALKAVAAAVPGPAEAQLHSAEPSDYQARSHTLHQTARTRNEAFANDCKQLHLDSWKQATTFVQSVQEYSTRVLQKQEQMEQRHTDFVLGHVAACTAFPDRWLNLQPQLPKRKKEYTGHARAEKAKLDEDRRAAGRVFFADYVADLRGLVAAWGDGELIGLLSRALAAASKALTHAEDEARRGGVSETEFVGLARDARAWAEQAQAHVLDAYRSKCELWLKECVRCQEQWDACATFADMTALAEDKEFKKRMKKIENKLNEARRESLDACRHALQQEAVVGVLSRILVALSATALKHEQKHHEALDQRVVNSLADIRAEADQLLAEWTVARDTAHKQLMGTCASEVWNRLVQAVKDRHIELQQEALFQDELAKELAQGEQQTKALLEEAKRETARSPPPGAADATEASGAKKKKKRGKKKAVAAVASDAPGMAPVTSAPPPRTIHHPPLHSNTTTSSSKPAGTATNNTTFTTQHATAPTLPVSVSVSVPAPSPSAAQIAAPSAVPSTQAAATMVPQPTSTSTTANTLGSQAAPRRAAGLDVFSQAQLARLQGLPPAKLLLLLAQLQQENTALRRQLKASSQAQKMMQDEVVAMQAQFAEFKHAMGMVAGALAQPSVSMHRMYDDATAYDPAMAQVLDVAASSAVDEMDPDVAEQLVALRLSGSPHASEREEDGGEDEDEDGDSMPPALIAPPPGLALPPGLDSSSSRSAKTASHTAILHRAGASSYVPPHRRGADNDEEA